MNILFADDDQECRKLMSDLLSGRPDYEIVFAADGSEAWWHLTDPHRHIDLLITDIGMDVVDGIELIRRVQSQHAFSHLPIILCSGRSDVPTLKTVSHLGIKHYVLKPFRPHTMLEKIMQFDPAAASPTI